MCLTAPLNTVPYHNMGFFTCEHVVFALYHLRRRTLQTHVTLTCTISNVKNRWRLTLVKPEPFNVRGKNYAVEMTTDVGFLATGLTPLKERFGLEIGTGNPFALPCVPSLNAAVAVARGSGSGNGIIDKGSTVGGNVAKGRGQGVMTADLAATGGKAAPGHARGRGKAEAKAKQTVLSAARGDIAGDIKPAGGSDTAADRHGNGGNNTDKPPAVSATATAVAVAAKENQTRVEGSGGALNGDGVAQVEGEVRSRRSNDEEDRPSINNADHEEGGAEGGGDGGSASIHEVLCMLAGADDGQRARLARAQRFLEEEVAR